MASGEIRHPHLRELRIEKKKGPFGPFLGSREESASVLCGTDLLSLGTLLALGDLEGHALSFGQRPEA